MAWIDPPAGTKITAAKLAELASYAVPISAVTPIDQPRASNITPQADPYLSVVLPANRIYEVTANLGISSVTNAAGGYRMNFAWTNSATVTRRGFGLFNTIASGTNADIEALAHIPDTTSPTADVTFGASTTPTSATQVLRVVTGGSDVTLTLWWAQRALSVSATNLLEASELVARRKQV